MVICGPQRDCDILPPLYHLLIFEMHERLCTMNRIGSIAVLLLLATLIAGCSISLDIRRPLEADDQVEALMQRYFDAFNLSLIHI